VQTLRFASANVAARHPLELSGAATWRRSEGAWSCTITLGDLPNDHIVVPSFASKGAPHSDFAAELVAVLPEWIRFLAEHTGITPELTERCLTYASGELQFPGILDDHGRPNPMARVTE